MPVLEAKALHKRYEMGKHSVNALVKVDFVVKEGEFVAIMGPSGSGKSTLLHLIGGLDKPSDGEVTLAGQRLSLMKDKQSTLLRRRNVGFVFQFFNLIPTLTVLENVMLPQELAGQNSQHKQRRISIFTEAHLRHAGHHQGHRPGGLHGHIDRTGEKGAGKGADHIAIQPVDRVDQGQ